VISVALTGGIGSGKSTVAQIFAELGAFVVDADAIARLVVMPGGAAFAGVVERFGPGVVSVDGNIDRKALADIVFADAQARRDLESLTHPAIAAEIARRVAAAPPSCCATVLEIPLLTEITGASIRPQAVVVVDAPEEVVLERLAASRQMTRSEAIARIEAQASREQRIAIADFVIDNSSSLSHLGEQVERVWERLLNLESAP
jgi:dephospho-CoA kinase